MTRHATRASVLLLPLAFACAHRPAVVAVAPPRGPSTVASSRPAISAGAYVAPTTRLGASELRAQLPSGPRMTAQELVARHAVSFGALARVDPAAAPGMSTVQSGPFALREPELAVLRANGFVLAPRLARANFLTGYVDLYLRDQPVYLSADAVANALHESFDTLMSSVESDALSPALAQALERVQLGLRGAQGAALSPEARGDVDTYVAISLGLLTDRDVAVAANGDADAARAIRAGAARAAGTAQLTLFGAPREVDFSQMRPRGHYAGNAALEKYFRAMMWLGREGMRLVDVVDGQRVLRRRQVSAALAMRSLSDAQAREAFGLIDEAVSAFAGEAEALSFRDLDALASEVDRAGGMSAVDDARLLAIVDSIRGERPRVATSILVHPEGMTQTIPMPVAFSLSPQRYTPDSRVLTLTSFDRIDGGRVRRMLPDPLDAAFGALGNDQAASLLAPQLTRFGFATELETARSLVDAHERSYWQGSLYASWMSALRSLSPRDTLANSEGLPAVMTTEAWGRRLLNTQLAAWAEVRHDTLLYTAQSYSASLGCSYPSAYVDPYPEYWAGLSLWVDRARSLIQRVSWRTAQERDRWSRWATNARAVTARLATLAQRERAGQEIAGEDLAWINQALNAREVNVVCATEIRVDGGWFYELFEPRRQLGENRAIVADIHTAPEDAEGHPTGDVLHIGTGHPQPMVVLAGPRGRERAYVGFASRYLERTTRGFDRLTDERWRAQLDRASAPAWMASISGPSR